jgi:hypothetical protein
MNIDNVPDKNAVELLREGRHNAWRVRDFKTVHVTIDFMMRLKACKDFESIVSVPFSKLPIDKDYPPDLFGFPYVVHYESCPDEFWFEDEYGKKIEWRDGSH